MSGKKNLHEGNILYFAQALSIYIFFFIVHSKGERTSGELTREEFSEFKSILLFYVDFCQKQKVMVIG